LGIAAHGGNSLLGHVPGGLRGWWRARCRRVLRFPRAVNLWDMQRRKDILVLMMTSGRRIRRGPVRLRFGMMR
jgi:hypothetical protein